MARAIEAGLDGIVEGRHQLGAAGSGPGKALEAAAGALWAELQLAFTKSRR